MEAAMRRLLIVMAGVAFAAALAWAQPSGISTPWTGAELINIILNNGSAGQITLSQIRNSSGIAVSGTVGGTSGTNLQNPTTVLSNALTGALTVNTPLTPYNGMEMSVVNGTTAAFTFDITVQANPSANPAQTVVNPVATALAAGTSGRWQFYQTTNTWYRIR